MLTAWVPGEPFSFPDDFDGAPGAGARFGFSVAMNDTYAVVGAPDARLYDADSESQVNGAGAAYVFKRSGSSWVFQQRLVAPVIALAQMGHSVAMDRDSGDIVVGAWAYNGRGFFSGAAFYFKRSGDSWGVEETSGALGAETRMPSQNLIPTDLQQIDEFGFSVAISGDTIAVGCPLSGTSNAGAVYTYERTGAAFTLAQKLVDSAAGSNDQLGTKIALDGDILLCGVQNDDVQGKINAGSALVFTRTGAGENWSQATKISRSTPTSSAQFGASVAVRDGGAGDDYIAIGAPTMASGASSSVAGNGAVFVYRRVDGTNWVDDQTLLPRADNTNNNFGYSVAMSPADPPLIVAGSPGYDTIVPSIEDPAQLVQVVNAGAAFCFTRAGGSWRIRSVGAQSGDLWSPDIRVANTSIGRSVAIGDSDHAIAAAETPSASNGTVIGFSWENAEVGVDDGQVPGPAGGVLSGGGGGGGGGGGTGSGGTGGGITGGGAPGGATDTGGGFVIPLTPIVEEWGVIKGTAIAVSGRRISALQTDGVHDGNRPQFRGVGNLPPGSTFVGLGDMNGDNSGDIVFVTEEGVLKYWKRDAFTVQEEVTIDSLPTNMVVVAVADVNGDNKADIVMQDATDSRAVTVWNMSGGSISDSREIELPEGEWTVHVAPFESDGTSSILIRNPQEYDLRLVVEGDEGDEFVRLRDAGPGGRIAGVGDMDSDGQPDIWWQGGDGLVIDFYEPIDGGGYRRRERMETPISGGRIATVRDWNGDGVLDVWMRRGDRNYIIYLSWDGHPHMERARDIGNAPGRVVGFADR